MRNTTFVISGGAGRVVTAIPALEKYHRLNPDDDFKVLIYSGVIHCFNKDRLKLMQKERLTYI